MSWRKNRHTVRTSAQFSAYEQWLSDCEDFLSWLDREKQYNATELIDLFRKRSQWQKDSIAETPALLRTLARYENKKKERAYIEQLKSDILALGENKGIIPDWNKEKFWAKLFGVWSGTTDILYGQYDIKQESGQIKAIIYLAQPYKHYAIFVKENHETIRYKLHEKHKPGPKHKPHHIIDEYVDLRVEHAKFLQDLYTAYNTVS